MTEPTSKVKQRVVFEEEPYKEEEVLPDIQHLQDKMVFGEDEQMQYEVEIAEQIDQNIEVERILTKPGKKWSIGAKLLMTSLAAIVGIEMAQFFIEAWSTGPIMASLYTTALVLALGIAGKVSFAEYRQLKKLKKLQNWQQASQRMDQAEQIGEALKMCDTINKELPKDMDESVARWRESLQKNFTDKEVLTLYSDMVLNRADDKALKVVTRYASETSLMVAISPLAVMDMALVLWRSVRMIDEICQLYGVKLGYWSRIKLLKTVMHNVVYAGVSELVADVGAAALSLELAGKLSSRAAQGLGAGLLTGRLGFQVMALCRPVPALPNKQKRLGDLSKQLLGNIRRALTNRPE